MSFDYLYKKKHKFKKRSYKSVNQKMPQLKMLSLYTLYKIRFELVYLRQFKKLIRFRSFRKKSLYRFSKYWFFLKPNYILSNKSTNSRMGAGVGTIVRLSIFLNPHKKFVSFKKFSQLWVSLLYKTLRYRIPFLFFYSVK